MLRIIAINISSSTRSNSYYAENRLCLITSKGGHVGKIGGIGMSIFCFRTASQRRSISRMSPPGPGRRLRRRRLSTTS